jgi:O-acetyl-ADP-ribose deacetylase (regulator of RNase III)
MGSGEPVSQTPYSCTLPAGAVLEIALGDITDEPVDAIVNAANAYLQHGGGVAGAISRRGGAQIQAESNAWVRAHGKVTHALPAYTGAGKLPCRYVIHAVGPVWGEGQEEDKLAQAVSGSLELAQRLELSSIALPAISTGIFGFPVQDASRVILQTIVDFFTNRPESRLRLVRLVLFDQKTRQVFLDAWQSLSQYQA